MRSRVTAAVAVALAVAVSACGEATQPANDAADAAVQPAVDAAVADARPFVPGGAFSPATIRFVGDALTSFSSCELNGQTVDYGARVFVDECVECQCTTYGLRCRRRATCPDARCVFVDGQVVVPGGVAIVETCFDCTCGDDGPACRRRTAAPCPVDGCKLAGEVLAIGAQRLVSECHVCECDDLAGLLCRNVCHPVCACTNDTPGCAPVCAEHACPLAIPDQDRVDLSCGSPVCDYGGLVGAPACGF